MSRTKKPYRRGDDVAFMAVVLFGLAVVVGLLGPIMFPGNRMVVPYVLGIGTSCAFCIVMSFVLRGR